MIQVKALVVVALTQVVLATTKTSFEDGHHSTSVLKFVRDKILRSEDAVIKKFGDASQAHRVEIQKHFMNDSRADAGMWLDAAIGFPNHRSRAVVEEKFRQAIRKGRLIVGVMGISTTAGHDIYHSQSFPHVFGRHFGSVLEAAGVELLVRNHAVGGFGVMPTSFCVQTIVGDDVDILVWDYMMMAPPNDCRIEHFARAGLNMPSKPVILFWQGAVYLPKSGKFNQKNVKAPTFNAKQSCGKKWIVDAYADIGAHYGNFAAVLHYLSYLGNHPSLQQGTDSLYMDPTKGTPPDPDFGEPPLYTGIIEGVSGKIGGAFELQRHRRLARHHAGAELNRMWGLAWAHAYLGVLMSAIRDLRQPGVGWAEHGPDAASMRREPPVAGCLKKICDKVVPTCLTTLLPRVEPSSRKHAMSVALEGAAVSGHAWELTELDNRGAPSERYGYVDRKIALVGKVSSGPLTFFINVTHPDLPISVCELPCAWGRCKGGRVALLGNSEFYLDDVTLPPGRFLVDKNLREFSMLVQKDTCFIITSSVSKGHHTVTIKAKTATADNFIAISHLIHF